jgi:hypothetical protein
MVKVQRHASISLKYRSCAGDHHTWENIGIVRGNHLPPPLPLFTDITIASRFYHASIMHLSRLNNATITPQ